MCKMFISLLTVSENAMVEVRRHSVMLLLIKVLNALYLLCCFPLISVYSCNLQ